MAWVGNNHTPFAIRVVHQVSRDSRDIPRQPRACTRNATSVLGDLMAVLNWQPKCLGLPLSSDPGDLVVVLSQQPKELSLPASGNAILARRVRRRGIPTQVLRPLPPAARVAQSADQ